MRAADLGIPPWPGRTVFAAVFEQLDIGAGATAQEDQIVDAGMAGGFQPASHECLVHIERPWPDHFDGSEHSLEESDAFIDFRQGDADGDPAVIERDGWRWEVRMTDVEGLVDLYTAPLMSWPFCRGWTTLFWWQRGCAC